MIGKSHLAMAAALAACAAGIGGFFYGTSVGVAQEQASQKRADDAREAERKKLQGKLDASSEAAQAKEYARQGIPTCWCCSNSAPPTRSASTSRW